MPSHLETTLLAPPAGPTIAIYSPTGAALSVTPIDRLRGSSPTSPTVRLVEGVAQVGVTRSASAATFDLWSSAAEGFAVTLTPLLSSCGDASQSLTLSLQQTSGGHDVQTIHSPATSAATRLVHVPRSAQTAYLCKTSGCRYSLAVTTPAPCRFALLQTSDVATSHTTAAAALPLALADGIPVSARSDVNSSRLFAITVPNKDLELLLTLTPLSGDGDLYASTQVHRDRLFLLTPFRPPLLAPFAPPLSPPTQPPALLSHPPYSATRHPARAAAGAALLRKL